MGTPGPQKYPVLQAQREQASQGPTRPNEAKHAQTRHLGTIFVVLRGWIWGTVDSVTVHSFAKGMVMFINDEKVCEVPGTVYHTLPSPMLSS